MQNFFSKAIEFLSPTEMLAGCWNSMALAFLTFPQIQELNHSFRTYISLEKLLKRAVKDSGMVNRDNLKQGLSRAAHCQCLVPAEQD